MEPLAGRRAPQPARFLRWLSLGLLSSLPAGGITLPTFAATESASPPQVIAYVFPNLPGDRPLQPADVRAEKLTRINYAFALIRNGLVVEGEPGDAANLAMLGGLRRTHPSLKLLVSIGGWLGSGGFSDASLTAQSRKAFVDSALAFVDRYQLDGLDLDWEYPGLPGAGNTFRPEDGQNFALLLQELRLRCDSWSAQHHRAPLLLSIAAGASVQYLDHTPMAKLQASLDTINLMTYDFYEAAEKPGLTGNHAPLFADPADPQGASSAAMVAAFKRSGVPAHKLVLGVPFYGRAWKDVAPENHGLFQMGVADHTLHTGSGDVAALLASGFTRYWDSASKVPFLYNATSRQFVSYEDPESLRRKCAWLQQQGLGGVMFWQLLSDSSGDLLNAIGAELHPARTASGSMHP